MRIISSVARQLGLVPLLFFTPSPFMHKSAVFVRSTSSSDTTWSQFRYGSGHSGFNYLAATIGTKNVASLTKSWNYSSGSQQSDDVVGGGAVYFIASGKLVSVDIETGKLIWSIPWVGIADPAYANGTVYDVDQARASALVAIDAATGKTKWRVTAQGVSWPSIAHNVLYVTLGNGKIVAYRASSGKQLWSVNPTKGRKGCRRSGCLLRFTSVTPVEYAGLVWVTARNGYAYAVGMAHGRPSWSTNLKDSEPGTTTLAASDGHLLVTTTNAAVESISTKTGTRQWTYTQNHFQGAALPTGLAAAYGLVFVTGLGDGPHGANPTGEALNITNGHVKWTFTTYGYSAMDPSVANGVLYAEDSSSDMFSYDIHTGNRLGLITGLNGYGPTYPAIVGSKVFEAGYAFTIR